MKKNLILFLIFTLAVFNSANSANFFKKFEKSIKKKLKEETAQSEEKAPLETSDTNLFTEDKDNKTVDNEKSDKSGGLLELGKKFGIKDKTLDIISSSVGVIKSQQEISIEEENDIGGSLALEIIQRYDGAYNNEIINDYVNLVGQSIVKYSDNTGLEFKFLVLNSDEINAFAAPGGYVFITKGLLRIIQNESQLAGVLAHEIAHITQRHILKTLQRGKFLENLAKLSATAAKKDAGKYTEIMGEVNKTLFEKGLDKSFEFEADAAGVELCVRTGYNPLGLLEFLNILNLHTGKKKSIFFSTHPSAADRSEKLRSNISLNYNSDSGAVLTERFKKFVNK
ncbi:MAG TPA: M48 family metalloprotease [bacterium]|nr:M48 family metalloprotease [bacterium]